THLAPNVGILSTPVIDLKTSTIYVVSRSRRGADATYLQQLHARALDTGVARKTPVTIAAELGGIRFNAAIQLNRPGLVVARGLPRPWTAGADRHHRAPDGVGGRRDDPAAPQILTAIGIGLRVLSLVQTADPVAMNRSSVSRTKYRR